MQHLQKREVLSVNEANSRCLNDLYNPLTNSQGFVNFGFAKNGTVIDQTISYLPRYIRSSDCNYQPFKGSSYINKFAATGTSFCVQETIVVNHLLAAIDILAQKKRISFQGDLQNLMSVFDHAGSEVVQFQKSEIHFVIYPKSQVIKKWVLPTNERLTVLVVRQKSQIIYSQNETIIYAYQVTFKEGYKFGVCHSKNYKKLAQIQSLAFICFLSSIIPSTIEALQTDYQTNASIQKQFMNRPSKHKNIFEPFHLMISSDSGYDPSSDHLFFCIGATGCLNNWAYSLFKNGDSVGIDAPFYFFMKLDFMKSGFTMSFRDMLSCTLMERIIKSEAAGQKGYIVVNPHNPTGKVFSPQQIDMVCKWAIQHPHYHVLINEVYLNSVYREQTKIISAVSYADKYHNITVIRGFAKDYGVCGFKCGFMISCNPTIISNFNKWKQIISPQPYVIKMMSRLLQESDYGQKIYKVSRVGLNESTNIVCKLLEQYKIGFVRPEAAVFIIIDLRKYLQEHTQETEQSMWCKLFYDHKVCVMRGLSFNMSAFGFFRMTHISKEQNIQQGLRRINNFMKGLPSFIK